MARKSSKPVVAHVLACWASTGEPGWLVRSGKRSAPMVKLFDELDSDDASWEPPVGSWFVHARATRRALDAISIAKDPDRPFAFCAGCYYGEACEAWGGELEKFGYSPRDPEDVGTADDADDDADPFGDLVDRVAAAARRWFDGDRSEVPPEILEASERLEISWPVTREEVETAFRRSALANHPDRGGTDAAMAEVNLARDVLLRACGAEA